MKRIGWPYLALPLGLLAAGATFNRLIAQEELIRVTQVGVLPTRFVSFLQFVSTRQGWVASENMLWRTEDGGLRWLPVPPPDKLSVVRFRMLSEREGWVANRRGLFWTRDLGANWESGPSLPPELVNGRLVDLCFRPNRMLAWAGGGVLRGAQQGSQRRSGRRWWPAIFRTWDGGRHWVEQHVPSASEGDDVVRLVFVSDTAGLAFLKHRVLVTIDGGDAWKDIALDDRCTHSRRFDAGLAEPLNAAFLDGGPIDTAFVNERVGWLSDNNGYLLQTTTGGQVWCDVYPARSSAADPNHYFSQLGFVGEDIGWALDVSGRLIHTTDGGRTWRSVATSGAGTHLAVLDRQAAWLVIADRLFRLEAGSRSP